MATSPRRMLKVGVEGGLFCPHNECPTCAVQGCVPVDAPLTLGEARCRAFQLLTKTEAALHAERLQECHVSLQEEPPMTTPPRLMLEPGADAFGRLSPHAESPACSASGCVPVDAPLPETPAPSALRPCCFCGHAGPYGVVENPLRYVATQCLGCGARGPLSSAEGTYPARVDEAAAQWNTRTPLPDEAPQVLLPCPGCGAPAYLRSFRGIRCSADPCGWEVTGWTEADMVTRWNTRTPLPDAQHLRKAALAVVARWRGGALPLRTDAVFWGLMQALEKVLCEEEAP